jgi:F0F1-type ATP synthase membrane subunit b/b'
MILEVGFAIAAVIGVYAVYKASKPKVLAIKEDISREIATASLDVQRSVANTEATVEAGITQAKADAVQITQGTETVIEKVVTDVENKL